MMWRTWTNSASVHCRYSHDGSHHTVSTYGADLVDLQVRQVAHMLTVDECVAEDAHAPGSIAAQFTCAVNVRSSAFHGHRPRTVPQLRATSCRHGQRRAGARLGRVLLPGWLTKL